MRNKFLVYACVGCLTASLLLVGCGNKPAEPVSTNSQTAQTATAESATKETASVNLSTEEIAILSTAGHPAMAGKELDDTQKATLDNWETAKAYIKEKYPDVEYKATTYKATSSNVNIQFTTTDGENITVTVSTDGSCTDDYALTEAKHLFEKVITEKFTGKYGEGNVNISIDMTLKMEQTFRQFHLMNCSKMEHLYLTQPLLLDARRFLMPTIGLRKQTNIWQTMDIQP